MKLKYIFAALVAALGFTACVEEQPVSFLQGMDVSNDFITLKAEGSSASFTVMAEEDWTVTIDEKGSTWLSVDPKAGKAGQSVTVTVSAPAATAARKATVSIITPTKTKLITVAQEGDKDKPVTCKDVMEGESNATYRVAGKITKIVNTQYGNLYINDGTVDGDGLYIYGIKNDKDKYPKDAEGGWESFGIEVGDLVVLEGPKTVYQGTVELVDAVIISVEKGTAPILSCEEPEKIVPASDTEATFTISAKNLTEDWTVTTDASWITDYTKSGKASDTQIVVKFSANESPEAREATLTVKSKDAADLVLTLRQGGYSAFGTLDNPYTPSQLAEALLAGGTVAGDVYIKGKVSAILYSFSASYGTGTFWISDDGVAYGVSEDKKSTTEPSKDFECYGVYWLGNTPWADGNAQLSVGDEVVICGQVTVYNGTAETSSKKAYVYSVNWATTDANGLGSVDYPFNIAGAEKFIDDTQAAVKAASDAGATLTLPDVAVKGKVSAVLYEFSANYGTGTFWISDDGTAYGVSDDKKSTTEPAKDFEVYSAYFLENKPWEEGNAQVAVGDEVIIKGQLTLYKSTYETSSKKAYVYSLNGATQATPAEVVPELYLNEFDCQNKQIEIYNATDAEVDMTGWIILKNDGEEGEKDTFSIPAALAKVPAKGYAVFTCKQTDAANGPMFGLSGTKGFKIALKKGDAVVDEVDNLTNIVTIEDGKSWGRETDGADKFVIFDTPTIGAANGAGTPPPAAPKTIAELIAAIPASATGSSTAVEVDVDFTEPVTVSYVNGKNAYLEDATAGILLFLENHGLQAGLTLKGQLKVTGYWYNGIPELTAYSGTPTVGQGTIPETPLTIAELIANYDKYLLRRIKLSGVTVTDAIADGDRNGKISQGTDEIAVYAQLNNQGLVLTEGAVGDLITIPGYYKTNKQVYFWQNDWFTKTSADPTITVSDITNVPAAGVAGATTTVTFTDAEGWTASVTPDGTVVTAASIDGSTITYTVAENTATEAREGKITVALKKDGQTDITKDIKVSQKAAEASTLQVGTVLWAEAWDGAAANDEVDTYNYNGTTVFGGASVTYTFTDAGTNTKLYVDNQMDSNAGNQGNLLVSKGNGSFTVAGIPVEGVKKATLTIYISNKNYPLELSTTTAGIQLGERVAYGESAKPYKLTWEITNVNATTIDLTLTNVNASNNNRLDNMSLVVTELGEAVQLDDSNGGIPDYGSVDFEW